ncbi:MAG TPA: hypothetical protein VKZ81_09975 [Pseudonocardia sp.]|uniref:hypothetical protein n=1 Tax=Pseudonocardia sp. TaxID=60912 RepID=UPI002B4AF854|nr:hypothetical protein [Pseudonocardia sp.]HLU55780.1 hypothetical protein [Pseudonocardia sp.]
MSAQLGDLVQLARDNPVVALILASEAGFWVLLGLGLATRYLLRLRALSTLLLAGIPLVDVVLVVAVALDLLHGAEPRPVHGLAGVYLGFSVAFGPSIVRWADVRFAHRFAGGPPPVKPAKGTPERIAHLWREWGRVVTAATITTVVLGGLVLFVASPEQADELWWWIGRVWVVAGIWLLAGPLWESGEARVTAGRR